ncbi:omega-oxo-fatty acid dehydrogenase [Syntrophotalea carbinolica DSM 2380]|uniref:Aldehyde dehydrogenase n=1 Tax=Syntrophotalea carbinolica (strain DSM 2380 / NBRC 103641 / GraBd1) TaxID=338963 RepID=Q3A3W3_SYNC1|nr:aldehyde dehydrogenase family protein [Syntrophotalea carbinolica]ABA88944.1 omega-oxo-fatty acid dehydrogenase [Syntrophotalea carbinolica DSM 2380]
MLKRNELYINGQWIPASGDGVFEVVNPATEETIGTVPAASVADADAAVRAARNAFEQWSTTPVAERANWLEKIHVELKHRAEEMSQVITAELGMPFKLTKMIQVGLPLATLESFVNHARSFSFEERIGHSLIVKEPAGVVAAITPWNYPLHQIIAKVAPALVAGCPVVLKPSEVTPLNAFLLADVIAQVGLPPGVFNLVSGAGPVVGEHLAGHADVDLISFTGSTRAGKRVAELAAEGVKRVALELGGKSPSVILDDADLPEAVKGTVKACFLNSGQTCSAWTRMLVPEELYEEAAELAVNVARKFVSGDPMDQNTRLGPLVSKRQYERVTEYIRGGIQEGAMLLLGGTEAPAGLDRGYYVQPTVFGRVTPKMTIAQEEIFGPVLSIMTYKTDEEAVALANATPYGLAAGVWSADAERAMSVARRLRAGQVDINGAPYNTEAPFGGYRQSGYGREMGKYGLEEFLEIKAIQL